MHGLRPVSGVDEDAEDLRGCAVLCSNGTLFMRWQPEKEESAGNGFGRLRWTISAGESATSTEGALSGSSAQVVRVSQRMRWMRSAVSVNSVAVPSTGVAGAGSRNSCLMVPGGTVFSSIRR